MSAQQHVIVIGAGVEGLSSALALHNQGFKVTILEQDIGVALKTSFANAGQISRGYSGPWATPSLPMKLPSMLFDTNSPLKFRFDFSSVDALTKQAKFSYWMLINCKTSRFERNKERIVTLSQRSKPAFDAIFGKLGLNFAHQELGTLQIFRTKSSFEDVLKNDVPTLREAGVAFTVVDADGCVKQEPALASVGSEIAGGIIFKDDATGDCRLFCEGLAAHLQNVGVAIHFGVEVKSIMTDGRRVCGLDTSHGHYDARNVLVACGPWTAKLLGQLGITVPIYPVRGYSMSAPIINNNRAPVSTILDETTKIAITRLGDTLRVGGTAEVSGFHHPADPRRHRMLRNTASVLFNGAFDEADGAPIRMWDGFRPMTPDGTPIISRTQVTGLFINAGHGTLGWTQAASSAEHIAAIIAGVNPVLNPADYALDRYGRRAQSPYFTGDLGYVNT
jgi:D-amino-acid dehydrogenase